MEDAFQGVAFHKRLNMSDPGWNLIAPWIVARYDDGTWGTISDGSPIAWLDSGKKELGYLIPVSCCKSADFFQSFFFQGFR